MDSRATRSRRLLILEDLKRLKVMLNTNFQMILNDSKKIFVGVCFLANTIGL